MISYVIPVEVDGDGNGRAPLPDFEGEPRELDFDTHVGANATMQIEGKEIVVASARPWSYFNVSFHVLEEHDIAHEPSSETRDVPSHAEITGQSVSE